jgi:hypothetical protein
MGFEDLTDLDRKLYEYIKARDFVTKKWSTKEAAKALGVEEEKIYQSLSNLARYLKDKIEINYRDGGLRIIVE